MSFAIYSGEEDRMKYNLKCIADARKALQDYPLIFKLVKNFDNFESFYEIENPFFWTCVKSQDKNPIFTNSEDWNNILKKIERVLKIIGIDKEKISRAISSKEANSYSLYSEILLYDELSNKVGVNNINHNPSINGKNPEYIIVYFGREICIEQTSLISGETEKKLKKLFLRLAKHIYQNLKEKNRLSITVNSFNLSWDKNTGLNLENSEKIFLDSINTLNLYNLFNTHNPSKDWHWDLISLSSAGSPILGDCKETLRSLEGMGKYLAENSDKEPCKSFLKNSILDIKSSPLMSFFSIPASYSRVDLHTELAFPSQLAEVERKAWLNSLERKINDKIKKNQFSSTLPNVLFINGDLWCLRDFYNLDDSDYQIVKDFLINLIENIKNDTISAIVLYSRTVSKRLVIVNPYGKNKLAEEEINDFF